MINRGVLAAGALVVLANGAILANVARNRAGNPDAVVRLSEREAQAYLPPDEQAELMLILRLRWQMALGPAGEDSWFTRERLEALGFPGLPAEGDTTYPGRFVGLKRKGYVVLEVAGPEWERWEAVQRARTDSVVAASRVAPAPEPEGHQHDAAAPQRPGGIGSRLMAVDIGRDPLALRAQYPERGRYLILPATYGVDFTPAERDSAGTVTAPPKVAGRIWDLLPGTLVVPEPFRDSLMALGAGRPDSATHYEFTVKVGSRWEAWVE
jgi:Domain of unknown function (DUF4824)